MFELRETGVSEPKTRFEGPKSSRTMKKKEESTLEGRKEVTESVVSTFVPIGG